MRMNGRWPLAVAVLVAGLTGCEAGERPGQEQGSAGAEGAADTMRTERSAPTAGTVAPINRSGVRGTASLESDAEDRLLRLDLEGMEPGTRYTAQVHEGRCVEGPGGGMIVLPLGRVMAGDDGTGRIRMRVAADRLPNDTELFVQVHAPDDRPVACANLER